jgi:hypothetical protein
LSGLEATLHTQQPLSAPLSVAVQVGGSRIALAGTCVVCVLCVCVCCVCVCVCACACVQVHFVSTVLLAPVSVYQSLHFVYLSEYQSVCVLFNTPRTTLSSREPVFCCRGRIPAFDLLCSFQWPHSMRQCCCCESKVSCTPEKAAHPSAWCELINLSSPSRECME